MSTPIIARIATLNTEAIKATGERIVSHIKTAVIAVKNKNKVMNLNFFIVINLLQR